VAGAAILPTEFRLEDCPLKLGDSKKLSKKQRDAADGWLRGNTVALGLGWVWPAEIDEHGLTWAVKTAMERALAEITAEYGEIIIDGNINYFSGNPKARAVVKADDSVPAVSAASIIAKVARDNYMTELGEQYAGYGFDKHVGYGTAAHIAALKNLGVSDIHRLSYKPIQAFMA